MNNQQYEKLATDLRELAREIPLHWGAIQNDQADSKLNMFDIDNFAELKAAVSKMNDYDKNYWKRRWYIWQCSQCDEYLFYCNDNVEHNPNRKDKSWDVRIDGKYVFDIKGTVIPQYMRDDAEGIISNPLKMVEFFYDNQSKGVRFDIQNRLFVVHHSFVDEAREFYLRCAWDSKRKIYREFVERINDISFINTHNVKAGVIFILEKTKGMVEYKICGL